MSTKLYVGNLSHETTETQLQTLFSEAGEVTSAKIITDAKPVSPGASALWRWKPSWKVRRPFPCSTAGILKGAL